MRRYGAWHKRGLFYLALTLVLQLGAGEDYQQLRAAVGLQLLDFDLFTANQAELEQAMKLWRTHIRVNMWPQNSGLVVST
ncbi:transcriptional regulator [Halorhodospira halochloris]|uniref:Transcriptional regulator n=1 Tax=Halorhodospira halochloris TaxID=1052 RepID=A0A0X8XAR5_HALHR|nr:transcriptional regulator [Halorhodospira halochloris]